jgi:4-hydroxybenzoate polyprenyltransferase
MNNRISFIGIGALFSIISAVMIFASIMDTTSNEFNFNLLVMIAFAVLAFTGAYLYPDVKEQDERSRLIRLKTFKFTFISLAIIMALVLIALALDILSINSIQLIQLIISISIIISSIASIFIAKNN